MFYKLKQGHARISLRAKTEVEAVREACVRIGPSAIASDDWCFDGINCGQRSELKAIWADAGDCMDGRVAGWVLRSELLPESEANRPVTVVEFKSLVDRVEKLEGGNDPYEQWLRDISADKNRP